MHFIFHRFSNINEILGRAESKEAVEVFTRVLLSAKKHDEWQFGWITLNSSHKYVPPDEI